MENPHDFHVPTQPAPEPVPFYNRFIQRGREGLNEGWRYIIGIVLTFIAGYSIVGVIPLMVLVLIGIVTNRFTLHDLQANQMNIENPEFLQVHPNILLIALLFIFVAAWFFLWIAVRFIHKKRFLAIINHEGAKFDFKRYFF